MITILTYHIAKHYFRRYYEDEGKDVFIGIFMLETFLELLILLNLLTNIFK